MRLSRLFSPISALLLLSCGGGETNPGSTNTPTGPTYHQDIAPLLNAHCTRCHQDGSIASFALTSYEQAKTMASAIADSTAARRMPPINVDQSGDCQTYRDANWLSDDELAKIKAWADGGTVEGDPPAKAPEPPAQDHLGPGAIAMKMAEPYTPKPDPAHPADDYRCFFLDPGIAADEFMNAFEIIPGERGEVHHMLLFSILTPEAEQKAQELEAADPEPGWPCFGNGGVNDTNLLAAWAPGKDVWRYPADTGLRIAGGRKLVMQIHYNLLGGAKPDQTGLKIETTSDVKKEAVFVPLSDSSFSLPPNQADATAGASYALTQLALLGIPEIELHGVFPHMHLLGKSQRFTVRDTGADPSEAQCLMDVPNWMFTWEELFFYEKPLLLKSTQTVESICHYDTRGQTQTVTFGEGTQDEMCIVFSYLTLPNGGKLPF